MFSVSLETLQASTGGLEVVRSRAPTRVSDVDVPGWRRAPPPSKNPGQDSLAFRLAACPKGSKKVHRLTAGSPALAG